MIASGAGIVIIAGGGVVDVVAPRCCAAYVSSAGIAIIAADLSPSHASSRRTPIPRGTSIAVITNSSIVRVAASESAVARVRGAGVVIVTSDCSSAYTTSRRTSIPGGTNIAIIAGGCIVDKLAPRSSVARIVGA